MRLLVAVMATLLGVAVMTTPASAAGQTEVRPVRSVDLERYQGRWVQLAAIPQPFQAQCARNDNATYTLLPQGQVKVLNSCTRQDGSTSSIEGRARQSEPGSTSKLEVSFVNVGGEWNFDRPGTYWVIGLDSDYAWAVVGAPDRKSGFVLARTPRPSGKDIAGIVKALVRNGYDPCDFRITAQDGGAPDSVEVCAAR
ncbi:lipocalin family protein [Lentzea sp. NPDC055074]